MVALSADIEFVLVVDANHMHMDVLLVAMLLVIFPPLCGP
jgi:hypothetical protein